MNEKKEELEKFLERIVEYFEIKDPYQILKVNPNTANDEKVENNYKNICEQLNGMIAKDKNEEVKKIEEFIRGKLDEAYETLKTEEAREAYNNKKQAAKELGEDNSKDQADKESREER